jgi:hypothetical protein
MQDVITPDLKSTPTKLPHQDFLLVLNDKVTRRESSSAMLRAAKAKLDPAMQLENWDASASQEPVGVVRRRLAAHS